jgi:peptide/nickel transport system permease protein
MASATVLLAFIVIGLLDSLHYRVALEGKPGQKVQYASRCCRYSMPWRTLAHAQRENLFEPFATRLYAKETIDVPGRGRCATTRASSMAASISANARTRWCRCGFTAFRPACWLSSAGWRWRGWLGRCRPG